MRASSRGDPEDGARSGVPRCRLATVAPGGPGTPPAGYYDLAARSSLHGSGTNAGEGSAGPEPKIATVERREASVSRETQGASLGVWRAALWHARGCPSTRALSRRSATPHLGARSKETKPGRKNAPRERRNMRC